MKAQPLWRILAVTNAAAETAISEGFEQALGLPPGIHTDAETGVVTIFHYTEGDQAKAAAQTKAVAEALAGMAMLSGLEIRTEPIKREDWAESWKKHFKPIRVGRSLLIRPPWSRAAAAPGQAVVVLDPGLSFGTGQHATTQFCLQQMVAAHRLKAGQSFWDAGTGSGILAIAAAKLGFGPIDAVDNDPTAVRSARANARRNRVPERIRFARADVTALPHRSSRNYDLVCANLMYDLLIAAKDRLLARVKPTGRLVLAGILSHQFARVEQAYAESGWRLKTTRVRGEWQSGLFQRQSRNPNLYGK